MQIYKVGIPEIAISPLVSKLKSSLYIGTTLWLVPGGSNIKLAVEVMKRIDSELSANLTITLTDERFGPYNHTDSNWHQLIEAGFNTKNAQLIEVLHPDDTSLEMVLNRLSVALGQAMEDATGIIGTFGMGADGHIAGILPRSVAASELSSLVTGYKSDPFTRITLTFEGIRRLNEAFLVAFGETKKAALVRLTSQELPLEEQPAQIIKQVGNAYVYNDQVEGNK